MAQEDKTVQSEIIKYAKAEFDARKIMALSYMLALPSDVSFDVAKHVDLVTNGFYLEPYVFNDDRGSFITPASDILEDFSVEPELKMREEWFAKQNWTQEGCPENSEKLREEFRAYSRQVNQVDFATMVKAKYDPIFFPYKHSFVSRNPNRVRYFGTLSLGSYSPMFGVFVIHDLANSQNLHLARISVVHHEQASMENIKTNMREIFGNAYHEVMPLLEKEFAKSDALTLRTMNSIIHHIKTSEDPTAKLEILKDSKHKLKDSTNRLQIKLDIVNKAIEQGLDFNDIRAMVARVFS